jgi:L-fuconolactonase
MTELASHENVHVKLAALPAKRSQTSGGTNAPLTSEEIAAAWRLFFEVWVGQGGARRCMFESNFPMEKRRCSYPVLLECVQEPRG